MRAALRRLAPAAVTLIVTGALAAAFGLAACNRSADAGATGGASANGSASGAFKAPGYVMGSPSAKVSVVEYLSDTCSHCAQFDQEIFPALKKKYIDTGKVKYEIREMLTPPEQISAAGFIFARCGGRDKYWPTIEAEFRAQPELFKTGDVRATWLKIAAAEGMSEPQFTQCLGDDDAFKALNDRIEAATKTGVNGTPTFIFNGKMINAGDKLGATTYAGGELTPAQFDAAYAAAGGK